MAAQSKTMPMVWPTSTAAVCAGPTSAIARMRKDILWDRKALHVARSIDEWIQKRNGTNR
jgi:hypothetical protein